MNIVMERCRGDLCGLISNTDVTLSIATIKAILFDVLSPLQYIHKRYIAHRVGVHVQCHDQDIKPENYLVGLDKRLRLSDFGLSRYVGTPRDHYTANVCTLSALRSAFTLGFTALRKFSWSLLCILLQWTCGLWVASQDLCCYERHCSLELQKSIDEMTGRMTRRCCMPCFSYSVLLPRSSGLQQKNG